MKNLTAKRWRKIAENNGGNIVVYKGWGCWGRGFVVDAVEKNEGVIKFKQVTPGWNAQIEEVFGYVGELGKEAAAEIAEKMRNQ